MNSLSLRTVCLQSGSFSWTPVFHSTSPYGGLLDNSSSCPKPNSWSHLPWCTPYPLSLPPSGHLYSSRPLDYSLSHLTSSRATDFVGNPYKRFPDVNHFLPPLRCNVPSHFVSYLGYWNSLQLAASFPSLICHARVSPRQSKVFLLGCLLKSYQPFAQNPHGFPCCSEKKPESFKSISDLPWPTSDLLSKALTLAQPAPTI